MTTASFFDLDHTLVDGDTELGLMRALAEADVVAPALTARIEAAEADYLAGHGVEDALVELARDAYGGRTAGPLRDAAAEFAERWLDVRLLAGARELVAAERERAGRVVLVTGSIDLAAAPVARLLGFDALVSTVLEVANDLFTGALVGPYCMGPAKARALAGWCAQEAVEPGECRFHGDGRSDLEAMALVGEPVAVNPTPELLARARRGGWRVLHLQPQKRHV